LIELLDYSDIISKTDNQILPAILDKSRNKKN